MPACDDDAARAHAKTHGDRVARMRHATVIDRTYLRGGGEPPGPVQCKECRAIAEARQAYFSWGLINGIPPFGEPR